MPHRTVEDWLQEKLLSLTPEATSEARRALRESVLDGVPEPESRAGGDGFAHDFTLDDLDIFDDAALRELLRGGSLGLSPTEIGMALHGVSEDVRRHVGEALPETDREAYERGVRRGSPALSAALERHLLDALFWELTYWKTPELYEELTEGEPIHAGIFDQLEPELRGKVVADAGAGTGRAADACLLRGVEYVYAIEPSPGLRRILVRLVAARDLAERVEVRAGRFDALGLADSAVDVTLACSAFTSRRGEGGEEGLAEMRRVTRPGGLIVIVWPRPQDYRWLAAHGFQYEAVPLSEDLEVRFRSPESALALARRFYAGKPEVERYLLEHGGVSVPYSLIGPNPPNDYCWLRVGR